MASQSHTHHQGSVKDPENDRGSKEDRETGHAKGKTPESEARTSEHDRRSSHDEHDRGSAGSSHSGNQPAGSHSSGSHKSENRSGSQSGGDDLKSREYKGSDGEIHHHTRTYQEQHGEKK